MKYRKLFCWLLLAVTTSITIEAQRTVIDLNRDWKFCRVENAGWNLPGFDDSQWLTTHVPHDFQISQPWVAPTADEQADADNPVANVRSRLSSRGFKEMGQGLYRKTFSADTAWQGKTLLLDFEGVLLISDVWVNGQKAASNDYGYLGFECDITDLIKYGEPNTIAVLADTGQPENSRWYTGGGLYRDVKLKIVPAGRRFVRHPLYVTTPVAEKDSAHVLVEATVLNGKGIMGDITIKTDIYSPKGEIVVSKSTSHKYNPRRNSSECRAGDFLVEAPELWSCESPNLYRAVVSLLDEQGNVIDVAETDFGIRKIEFSPEFGFKLNGEKVFLKGIANHHTLGALGAAAYPAAIEKRIKLLKEFGVNHIRTSHNPYSTSFLDLCDKHGILVVDELYDKWLTQYAGGRKPWQDQWQEAIPEWMRRDRNHPCVVAWSLGNELQIMPEIPYEDFGVTPYLMMKPLVKRLDATRPLTVAMHPHGRGTDLSTEPWELAKHTDIQAYNYRYMFFEGDGKRYPYMNFYQSEAAVGSMGPNFFEMDSVHNIGLAYWGAIDYLGESGGWPEKGWTKGVFDIALNPKPEAYLMKSMFMPDEPLVRVAVKGKSQSVNWNGVDVGTAFSGDYWTLTPGSRPEIIVYTNAEEAELLLNGKSLGRQQNDVNNSKTRNRLNFGEIDFKPGKLEAVAYRDGKPVARHSIITAGKAAKLTATPDNSTWRADGQDLQHILVQLTDKKGTLCPDHETQVDFTVEGPAVIVGVINGDLTSEELSTGTSRRLHNGRATVILRSLPTPGEVIVTATPQASAIKPVKLKMKTSL